MLAKVCSAAVTGIEAFPVEVEVNVGYGDTFIALVGLPDGGVDLGPDLVDGGPDAGPIVVCKSVN